MWFFFLTEKHKSFGLATERSFTEFFQWNINRIYIHHILHSCRTFDRHLSCHEILACVYWPFQSTLGWDASHAKKHIHTGNTSPAEDNLISKRVAYLFRWFLFSHQRSISAMGVMLNHWLYKELSRHIFGTWNSYEVIVEPCEKDAVTFIPDVASGMKKYARISQDPVIDDDSIFAYGFFL